MTQLKKLSVKIADEDQYNAVTEVLRSMRYKPNGNPIFSNWVRKYVTKNYHVLASEDCYAIHNHDGGELYTQYTVDEFLSKYRSLTKPLTIGEIHQLRELLKAHSPTTEQPEPKFEIYSGVFSFDCDTLNCNNGKQILYWNNEDEVWQVLYDKQTEPHILIEEPHEIGQFYLLGQTLDRENPKNYGLYDGKKFWRWNSDNEVVSTKSATNLKVVIA